MGEGMERRIGLCGLDPVAGETEPKRTLFDDLLVSPRHGGRIAERHHNELYRPGLIGPILQDARCRPHHQRLHDVREGKRGPASSA
jgi:hypothetical protein